ncbi:hypothetical protein [Neochlamydia sp. S13]|uniref:hypothetical protein n=1 Tax=Neochlamydia sp. S13 TaxID=1353976 RepID=UPI00131538B5|nr:hypothetical protein [Neochlamydia sp. S13]
MSSSNFNRRNIASAVVALLKREATKTKNQYQFVNFADHRTRSQYCPPHEKGYFS